jgi:threonine dehydratase
MKAPSYEQIVAARGRLAPYLAVTALRSYAPLDEAVGLHVLVKHENHQPTNSFKIRNALAAMTGLDGEQKKRGVIAATRGNHGAGIAWAGKRLGIPATVVVPHGNNPEKNTAIRGYGAMLVESGQTYDDAIAEMKRRAAAEGLVQIHSTNNTEVVAGAGTMSLEIFEQADAMGEKIDAMVFSVGGGSQAAGAMLVSREQKRGVEVFGVQTESASAYHDSYHAKKVIARTPVATIADGIATGTAYELTFPVLQGLTGFVLVSEREIGEALRLLLETTHNLVEGAGAAGLAGLRRLAPELRERGVRTACVVMSGGNIDQATLRRVMAREI